MKAPSPLAVVVGGLSAEQQPANGNIRSQPNSQILCQISLVHLKTSFIINIVTTIIARETPVICINFGETALVTVRQEESCLIVGGQVGESGLVYIVVSSCSVQDLVTPHPCPPFSCPFPGIETHNFYPLLPSAWRKCLRLLGYW